MSLFDHSGLIADYGYWAVLVLVGLESMGLPLPGETALIAAAVYAGTSHDLNEWALLLLRASARWSATTSGTGSVGS